jgi:hypothetical protein
MFAVRTLRNVLLCGLAALAGCSSNSRSVGPCFPVAGKVTLGGVPLIGGTVSFVPLDAEPGTPWPTGTIDSQGAYSLQTSGQEGAPAGKYRAIITTSGEDKNQDERFDSVYSHAENSPLIREVTENAAPGYYDLPLGLRR